MAEAENSLESSGPITFEDLGINRGPQLADSAFGKRREIKDLQKDEIAFVTISFLSILASLILTIIKLTQPDIIKTTDFTFALVLLTSIVFCTFYLFHGVLSERPYEVFVLSVATFIVWIYIIVNYAVNTRGTIKLVRLVASSVLSPVIVVLGVYISKRYHDSGRLIFRTVGANSHLQEMCKMTFAYLEVLKFDLQIGITMVLLILRNGSVINTQDIVILAVGIPVTLVFFALGYLCVRLENKILAIVFLISLILQPAYIIYKIVTTINNIQADKGIAATIFTCAGMGIIIRTLLVVLAVKVVLNFGNGLKEKVYGTGDQNPSQKTSRQDVESAQNRQKVVGTPSPEAHSVQ